MSGNKILTTQEDVDVFWTPINNNNKNIGVQKISTSSWVVIIIIYFYFKWITYLVYNTIAVPHSNGVCYCCRVYQHSANNRWIFITGLSQPNQRSVYENEYVRKAVICVLVGIAQLVEHPAETDQLTFIKRHRAFESRKLRLLFSFLFIHL